jgi:DNA polymerase III subunit epsilon
MKEITTVLELERPLIALDLETTGLYPHIDRICQIGVIKVHPNGEVKEWQSLINPGIPIPPHVAEIHGVNNELVKDAPLFAHIAEKLYYGFRECDFTGYNAKGFDIKFLVEEFRRCNIRFIPGRIVDAFQIFKRYHPRNLSAAFKHYTGEDLVGAHNAMEDARASLRVLFEQLRKHPDLPRSIEALDKLFQPDGLNVDSEGKIVFNLQGDAVFNFGKNRGVPLRSCDTAYFSWILQANFSDEVKQICREALQGKFPKR